MKRTLTATLVLGVLLMGGCSFAPKSGDRCDVEDRYTTTENAHGIELICTAKWHDLQAGFDGAPPDYAVWEQNR